MKAINLCLVAPLPPPYGGIAHWCGLITRYARRRDDVSLDVIDIAPRWRSIHDLSIFRRSIGGLVQMVGDLCLLLRVAHRSRLDVIHLTTSGHLAVFRDLGVMVISRLLRVPVVYHIRFGRVPLLLKSRGWEGRLITKAIQGSAVVVAIDEKTGSVIKQAIPRANVQVVPNCVDYSTFPQVEKSSNAEKVALFVGWVIAAKGVRELVSAWSRIGPAGWVLRIAGPSDENYIMSLKELFPSCRVEFLGELSHSAAMREMALCDLFVLPSYTEGFPNAVVEAMALGKAVVATKVGAIPEMLEQGECGVLIDPRDEAGLAEAMLGLVQDEALRSKFGQRAAKRALENYSIDSVFERYLLIWRSLANRVQRI